MTAIGTQCDAMTNMFRAEHSPGLLVSVRSVDEARAALAGGATLIDVKEPNAGPLGRAPHGVSADVIAVVRGRCQVSAALGELLDDRNEPIAQGLTFVKWGLAGYATDATWRAALRARQAGVTVATVVTVAYADWQCARAPSVNAVFAHAAEQPGGVLLIDTHCKDAATPSGIRPTLLDWLSLAEVAALCAECRGAGVRIALAGSLGPAEIRRLVPFGPDWIAVRGAACDTGRQGTVDAARVRALVDLIHDSRRPPPES